MRKSFLAEVNPESIDIKGVSSRVKSKLEQIKSYNSSLKQAKGKEQGFSSNLVKPSSLQRSSVKQFIREPRAKDNAFNRQVSERLSKLKTRKSATAGKEGKVDLQSILNKVNSYRDSIVDMKNKPSSQTVTQPSQTASTSRVNRESVLSSRRTQAPSTSLKDLPRANRTERDGSKRSSYKTRYQKPLRSLSQTRSSRSLAPKSSTESRERLQKLRLRREREFVRPTSSYKKFDRLENKAMFRKERPENTSNLDRQALKDKLVKGLNLKADFLESLPSSYGEHFLKPRPVKEHKVNSIENETVVNKVETSDNTAIKRLEEKIQQLIDSQIQTEQAKKLVADKVEEVKVSEPVVKQVSSNEVALKNKVPLVNNIDVPKQVSYKTPYELNLYKDNNNKVVQDRVIAEKRQNLQVPYVTNKEVKHNALQEKVAFNGNLNRVHKAENDYENRQVDNFHNRNHQVDSFYNKDNRKIAKMHSNRGFEDDGFDESYSAQNIDINAAPVLEDDISKDVLLTMLQSMLNKNESNQEKGSKGLEMLMQQLVSALQNQNSSKKDSITDVLIAQMIAKGNTSGVSSTDALLSKLIDKVENSTSSKSTDMVLSKLLENSLNNNNSNNNSNNDTSGNNMVLSKLLDNALLGANNKASGSSNTTDVLLSSLLGKLDSIASGNAKQALPNTDTSLSVEVAKISSHLENDRYNQNQRYLQDILHEVKATKSSAPAYQQDNFAIEDIKQRCNKIEKVNIAYINELENNVNSIKVSLESKLAELQKGFNVEKIRDSLGGFEEKISKSVVGRVEEIINDKIEGFGSNIQSLQVNLEEQKVLTQEDVDAKLAGIESYINNKLANSEHKIDQSLEDGKKLLEKQEEMVAKVLDNETAFVEGLQVILEKLDSTAKKSENISNALENLRLEQEAKKELEKQNTLQQKYVARAEKPKQESYFKKEQGSASKQTQKELLDNLAKISEVSKHLEKIKQEQTKISEKKEQELVVKDNKLFTFNKKKEEELTKVALDNKSPVLVEKDAKSEEKIANSEEQSKEEKKSYDTKEVFGFLNKPSSNAKDNKATSDKKDSEAAIKGDVLVTDYIPLSQSSGTEGKAIKAVWSDSGTKEELKNKWHGDKTED